MTIIFWGLGIFALAWGLPKMIKYFFARKSAGPEGRRIGWKIDKKNGKAYGLYVVNGKVEERGEEDVILDPDS